MRDNNVLGPAEGANEFTLDTSTLAAGLSKEGVLEVRRRNAAGASVQQIAKDFGVQESEISDALADQTGRLP